MIRPVRFLFCTALFATLVISILAMVMAMRGHECFDKTMSHVTYDPGWNWQALVGYAEFAIMNAVTLVGELRRG